MKNCCKLFGENSGKFGFMSFDRSTIIFDRLSKTKTFWKISSNILINRNLFWIDRSTSNQESIELDRKFVMVFFKFFIGRELFSIDRMIFFTDWVAMEMPVLPVLTRCLLDTFTLYHSWQKWGVVLVIRVVIVRGRVSIWDFC